MLIQCNVANEKMQTEGGANIHLGSVLINKIYHTRSKKSLNIATPTYMYEITYIPYSIDSHIFVCRTGKLLGELLNIYTTTPKISEKMGNF